MGNLVSILPGDRPGIPLRRYSCQENTSDLISQSYGHVYNSNSHLVLEVRSFVDFRCKCIFGLRRPAPAKISQPKIQATSKSIYDKHEDGVNNNCTRHCLCILVRGYHATSTTTSHFEYCYDASAMPAMLPGSQFTHFEYNPNVAANATVIALFSAQFLAQVVQGVHYKTWGFMFTVLAGLLLEIIGYTSRIFMHNNPSSREAFLM